MLSTRYHIGTIIAIFFALGIGIIIGGTLGGQFVRSTEDNIIQLLIDKYEEQIAQNVAMQKEIGSLQLINQTIAPILNDKTIVWIRPASEKNELLPAIVKSTGAEMIEAHPDTLAAFFETDSSKGPMPHIILVSDPDVSSRIHNQLRDLSQKASGVPKVVDLTTSNLHLDEPQDVVNFIFFIKKIIEEDSHAAFSLYRYSGLE
jgi:hypothetical protein